MAQATKQLIAGVDIEAVVKGLDRVRSSHLASMHWAHIVRDSLEGPALFLLAAERRTRHRSSVTTPFSGSTSAPAPSERCRV